MVHGLAGSAARILLSLEASESARWGVAYLAMFGEGSILGMALVSAAIAVPLRLTSSHLTWARGGPSTIVGIANIGLGGDIVYQSRPARASCLVDSPDSLRRSLTKPVPVH